MAHLNPCLKRSSRCTKAFTTRLCWCEVCKSNFSSGLKSKRICKCKEHFDAEARHHKLCKPCRDALKGHGHSCCEWIWVEQSTEQSTEPSTEQSTEQSSAPCTEDSTQSLLPQEVCREAENPSIATAREQETSRRLLWCIENSMSPAHSYLHMAPSTPEQDSLYGSRGPPWNPDGSFKWEAVTYGRKADMHIDRNHMLLDYENVPKGWACRKCALWIDIPPRAFVGGVEPRDWWWCKSCKNSSGTEVKKKREDSKRLKVAETGSRDIRGWGKVPDPKEREYK